MIQIIVLDHINSNEEQPVSRFLNGLAGLVGDRFITLPATFIEFHDPHLADQVTHILSQAGELYYMLPEEKGIEPESAQLDCTSEQVEAAINAIREKAESLAGTLEDTETIVALDPVYAWRETADLMEECHSPVETAVITDPNDPDLPPAFLDAGLAKSRGYQYDGAAMDPQPAKPKRGRRPRASAEQEKQAMQKQIILTCTRCGETYPARRKDQGCPKPECKRAVAAEYNRKWYTSKHPKKAADPQPDQEERPISEIDGLPVPHPSDPEPAHETPKKNGRTWLIEDGKQAGKIISDAELRRELEFGNLVVGQHVSNQRNGKCRIIEFKGKHRRLAIKQLFGEGANRIIDFGA